MAEPEHIGSDYELHHLVPAMDEQGPTKENLKNAHHSSFLVDSGNTRVLWTPFYLRRTTLIGFAVVKLGILLAIIALAVIDAMHKGIATANSSEHYLWTYGPTAVLSILAALWGQVEHRTKQGMPWKMLQCASSLASKTLLLDYVTPSLPDSLVNSIRLSHWPVTVAMSNSLLIKLITVASTGLLILQKTPIVYRGCHLIASNDFTTNFNASAVLDGLVLSVSAIQNGSIPYPPGTSHDTAFQQIEAATALSGIENAEVEGLSRVFQAGLDCEIGRLTSLGSGCRFRLHDSTCYTWDLTVKIDSPTCQVYYHLHIYPSSDQPYDHFEYDLEDASTVGCNYTSDGQDLNRLLFMVGRISQTVTHGQDPLIKVLDNDTTVILCQPKYNISSRTVRMDLHGNLIKMSQIHPSTNTSQPLPAWDLVDGLTISAGAAVEQLIDSTPVTVKGDPGWLWMLLKYLIIMTHLSTDLKDAERLRSSVNEAFSMATSQMVKANFMVPSATDLVGTCYGIEERLRVRGLSLYLMGATLILSASLALLLVYIAPRGLTSRDPASIGGLALILSSSPAIRSRLLNDGASDLHAIQHRLQELSCQSLLSTNDQRYRFHVQLTPGRSTLNTVAGSEGSISLSSPVKFWRPTSLRSIFKLLVIVFLLSIVATLEVLYSISQKHNGIAKVDPKGYVRFSWVYVPATIMLAAQLLIGMITFSSLFVFPYFQLRFGTCNMRNDILQDYISQTAAESAWKSATNRKFSVFFMALAMLLSPMLTIAVSGLYTAQAVEVQKDVTLSVISQLNTSQLTTDEPDHGEFTQAYSNVGLILTQNLTYPLWTYDELTFPGVEPDLPTPLETTDTLAGSSISARLPAVRAGLNCDWSAKSFVNFSTLSMNDSRMPDQYSEFDCYGFFMSYGRMPGAFGLFGTAKRHIDIETVYCGAYGTSEVDWRFFRCLSVVYQLDVDVTMDAATLVIRKAEPDESTLRAFANFTLTIPANFPGVFIPPIFDPADQERIGNSVYDSPFQAAIHDAGITDNPDNFPIDDYMDDEGYRRIETHLRHVLRIVMAQYANLVIRVAYNSSAPYAPPSTVNGTLTKPNVYRLEQSAISTRILDVLLIAISLCIAISFAMMDTRRVLPKNPASIAAAASMIAGEPDMLKSENLPEEAQWYTDAELEQKGIWSGCVFRLGWWEAEGQAARFGLDMGRVES